VEIAASPRAFPRYSEIDAAVRRLPILPEELWGVGNVVDELALRAMINDGGDGTVPAHFLPATAKMVAKQLAELERRADDLAQKIEKKGGAKRARQQLARHIRELNGPTLTAMSDVQPIDGALPDVRYFLTRLPEKLDAGEGITSAELRYWARIAKEAIAVIPKNAASDVGRRPDRRAQIVANTLAREYFNLTGKEPKFVTRSCEDSEGKVEGEFLDFVGEIFKLLNIERNPIRYASVAAYRLRGKGRKK